MNRAETRSFLTRTLQDMAKFAGSGEKTFAEMTTATITLLHGEVRALSKDVDILRREIRKLEEMIKDGTNGNDTGD